ncbi:MULTISPECIES: glycosyltransferase [unclassified Phenylobacterium]|jgi:glycosyltransferase involved in cell wall biosynthesis|uniref:glycosyltransferase n=1 Tax=unclassified Phenylobacterium TaxID=2640670 RepID=UPI00083B8B7E|nr:MULTISPECIES: glycosyltransferase [unclassified Phenylobacterium]
MMRIVYLTPYAGSKSGGNKMIFRHVESLCAMGFDAVVRRPPHMPPPTWFDHEAPTEDASVPLAADDILVLPEDSPEALRQAAALPNRKVIFCQNPYALASYGLAALPAELRPQYRNFMACGVGVAGLIARFFDYDQISVVPGFADERLFRPAPKERLIACSPRHRKVEQAAIRYMFERLHPDAAAWRWEVMETRTEAEVADIMGRASVFLSLARMEALSLTTLEAMACECLLAGFTGIGAREFATPVNGIWVDEDDCEAAAHALARAATLAGQGGGAQALMRHAAAQTAAQWSRAAFIEALAAFWRDRMGVTA